MPDGEVQLSLVCHTQRGSYLVNFFRLVIVVFVASVSLRWAEVRLISFEPATAQVMSNVFALAPELRNLLAHD
jgi:hypothetical protein